MEGLSQFKDPMTSFGFETATFLFVTQFLNQLRYRVAHGNKTETSTEIKENL
jgi:hypothetical protein